ncbi:Hypothetical protein SMAX5B_005309 [Scophthalmus maximus]|uniref:Uncharacterized protein n=1 Tax=Scophthalmus maximus TaxID=52904 RepID=A0A2U9CGR1_SCOMX|nr:Hypothetical protein SMAX5B_005309 [Scophthalmus maximus]
MNHATRADERTGGARLCRTVVGPLYPMSTDTHVDAVAVTGLHDDVIVVTGLSAAGLRNKRAEIMRNVLRKPTGPCFGVV